jgi:PAS domain S-box-containing protein
MKRSRLATRFLLLLSALFTLAVVLSAAAAAWTFSEFIDRQYRSKGAAIAETIAATVNDRVVELASLQATVEKSARAEGVAYIIVRDGDGDILAHTFELDVPIELTEPWPGLTKTTSRLIPVTGTEYLVIAAPIHEGEFGQVQVGMKQSTINEAYWRTIRQQAVLIGLIGAAAILATYFLARRITQPLTKLARHARKVASLESLYDSPSPVVEELAPIAKQTDEIGQLARSFTHMIDALGAREKHLKWAEESIRRSEAHYRSLIENVSDVIVLLDGVGNARYISASLESLLGFKPAEWLRRDVTLLVHPDYRDAFREAIDACLSRGGPDERGEAASVEVRMVRADGAVRIIDASLTNLLFDPAVGGVVVTLRDISDRQRTLELNHAREQAEEASRLKSQLLANISHEFYTPMHHILSLSDLTLDTEVNDEQRENLEMLRESAGDLLAVLQNILDFSQLEADKVRLQEAPFGLSELLHDVLALLGRRAQSKGLFLDADVSPEVPEIVVGDVDRLRQVLLQVVGNAIKFTMKGLVVVRVTTEKGQSDRVAFQVQDTGIGIPADRLRAIFDPFVQGDGSSTRRFGGTGLGLAVASSLVERMGGRIWVESEVGKGTTVHFTVHLKP